MLLYAFVAGLWILASDQALRVLVRDPALAVRLQTYKGGAFVVISALALYFGLRSYLKSEAEAAQARATAELQLRQQRERLALAVAAANIGFWERELPAGEVYFSPEWKRQLGYRPEELPNRVEEWESRIHPLDIERVKGRSRQLLDRSGELLQEEYRLRHKDGSYRWMLSQIALERDGAGRPVRLYGLHVDVTAAKLAELALQERSALHGQLAHIAAVVPGVILSYQELPDGKPVFPYASPAVEEIYGVRAEDIRTNGELVFDRIHPADRTRVMEAVRESARTMTPWRAEFRFNHPKKGEVWIDGFSLPERQPDGSLLWNGFAMDITARKLTELRVRQLNRVYAVLSEINQLIVRERDEQALLSAVCRVAVETGGFRMVWLARVEPATGQVVCVAQAGDEHGYAARIASTIRLNSEHAGPTALAARIGQHVVCNDIERDPMMSPWRASAVASGFRASAAFPIRVGDRVTSVLNFYAGEPNVFDEPELQLLDELALDIAFALEVKARDDQRSQTEATSRETEERFRQLAENIHEVFWLTDPVTRRILYVSPVYETVWGRTVESLYARPGQWYDCVHPEDRQRVIAAAMEKQASGTYDEEYRIVRPDGSVRWIRARAFPVRDAAGNVYRIAGVAEDITERKNLESQFFRAQRLEAIGTLASGIAHDLNNVLAPIMMCAPMLRMGLPPAEFERMVGTIEASTRRGADLVRQLLVFGRGIEGGRVAVSPRDLVLEMVKIACETFPKNIVVKSDVGENLWSVRGDPTQLHQVLLNLCVNARDAMPEGGELTLLAENVEFDPANPPPEPNARAGRYIRITVVDTGTGISPAVIDKIFDPFFTTKPAGQGTGLGLSTVLGLVKGHDGFVRLNSELGRGSKFEVFLPALLDGAANAPSGAAGAVPRGNHELVLLVEDEESIRDVVADVLIRQQYRVITADDGLEGETLFKENMDEIGVIVTDLDMPRMDGFRFIQSVRQISATVPVVVSTGLRSGRAGQERTTELEELGVSSVLAKPYGTEEILAAVHSALAQSRHGGTSPG